MGRYYWGDIEGKFAFGIQSSDDPAYFGSEPTYLYPWSCGCSTQLNDECDCGCELEHTHDSDCPENCTKEFEKNVQNKEEFNLLSFSFDDSQLGEIKDKLDNLLQYFQSSNESKDFLEHIKNSDYDYIEKNITKEIRNHFYEVYYRYEIGKEIYDCLLENEVCNFEAEL